MIQTHSFVSTLKDLYYQGRRLRSAAPAANMPTYELSAHWEPKTVDVDSNAAASGAFVNAMRAICDGNSHYLALNHPYYARYSEEYARELMWRCHLFNDALAFYLLQENYRNFFTPA